MTRRYIPDPEAVTTALAGRVDRLENTTSQTSIDLKALGRGVAHLTAQIRALATAGPVTAGTSGPDGSGSPDGEDEEAQGQPDWLSIDDVDTAGSWLVALADWLPDVLARHGLAVAAPCWPLHPDVVAVLLALLEERTAAYTAARPTAVSEWLARWLPAADRHVTAALAECVAERGHRENGVTHDATELDLTSIAAWWVTDRATPPARAFALPRLT